MKGSMLLFCFSAIVCIGNAQIRIDSVQVTRKIKEHVLSRQREASAVLTLSKEAGHIENRIDYSEGAFDFSRAEDAAYVTSKTRKVVVVKVTDVKHAGCDVYVQTATTKYPLTNMEVHADPAGKVIRDLPYEEIGKAMELMKSGTLLSARQVGELFKQHTKTGSAYTYANLLVDLPTGVVKWQLRGMPDAKSQKQELLEIDAFSGKVLSLQQRSMNIATASSLKQ